MNPRSIILDQPLWLAYWPFAFGGLIGPVGATILHGWMPLHYAAAASFVFAWTIAYGVFERLSVNARHGLPRTLAVGAVGAAIGAVVTGIVTYLAPWR
jgi:hypothetical protein